MVLRALYEFFVWSLKSEKNRKICVYMCVSIENYIQSVKPLWKCIWIYSLLCYVLIPAILKREHFFIQHNFSYAAAILNWIDIFTGKNAYRVCGVCACVWIISYVSSTSLLYLSCFQTKQAIITRAKTKLAQLVNYTENRLSEWLKFMQ